MAADDEALELKLQLKFVFYPPAKKAGKAQPWFKEKKHLDGVVDAFTELPLFKEVKLAGPDDKQKAFKNDAALKGLVVIGRDDWTSMQSSDDTRPDLKFLFQPSDEELDIKVRCSRGVLEKHSDTIIEQYIAATRQASESLRAAAGLASGYVAPAYRVSGKFAYPRPRPPRRSGSTPMHAVVDFIDLKFHGSKQEGAEPEFARAMTAAPPPTPARRTEKNDLVVIQWAKSADEAALQKAASEHESWISKQVTTPLEAGFNDLGDRIEDRGKAEARPPLTLYSASRRIGYKAVVVFPDGSIEPHAWNQAKMVLKDKATTDGSPVDAVKIVVPLREHVFTIAEEAKNAGFSGVLYAGNDGQFWDPNPAGMWLSDPTGADSAKPLKPRPKKAGSRKKS